MYEYQLGIKYILFSNIPNLKVSQVHYLFAHIIIVVSHMEGVMFQEKIDTDTSHATQLTCSLSSMNELCQQTY